MRRLAIGMMAVWAVTFAVTVAPPAARAQMVDQVTITGPLLARPITVIPTDAESSAQLDLLRVASGIEIAMHREIPGEFAAARPSGDLGPRYWMTWNVPGGSPVIQEFYPYAVPSPVVNTPPQRLVVRHGWFTTPPALGDSLRSLGLPNWGPRAAPATPQPQPRRPGTPWILIGVAIALTLAAAAWAVRSHSRTAGGRGVS